MVVSSSSGCGESLARETTLAVYHRLTVVGGLHFLILLPIIYKSLYCQRMKALKLKYTVSVLKK